MKWLDFENAFLGIQLHGEWQEAPQGRFEAILRNLI